MVDRQRFEQALGVEIEQAQSSSRKYFWMYVGLTAATLIVGGLASVVAAVEHRFQDWVAPATTALTTVLGGIATQTNFRKIANGLRLTKTEFQNLELQLLSEQGSELPVSYLAELQEIRSRKVVRTSDSA